MKLNNLTVVILKSHINHKESGFTLIELIVVLIVVTILSAVSLPMFLAQTARARQTEAETNLAAVNRAQQVFRLENPTFGTIAELGTSGSISISPGDYYTYVDGAAPTPIIAYINAVAQTVPKDYSDDIKNYQAAVNQNSVTGDFSSIICRSTNPTADDAAADPNASFCLGGEELGSK